MSKKSRKKAPFPFKLSGRDIASANAAVDILKRSAYWNPEMHTMAHRVVDDLGEERAANIFLTEMGGRKISPSLMGRFKRAGVNTDLLSAKGLGTPDLRRAALTRCGGIQVPKGMIHGFGCSGKAA